MYCDRTLIDCGVFQSTEGILNVYIRSYYVSLSSHPEYISLSVRKTI